MSFLFDKLFQKQNPELASEMAKRGLIFDRIRHRWVRKPENRANPQTAPSDEDKPIPGWKPKDVPDDPPYEAPPIKMPQDELLNVWNQLNSGDTVKVWYEEPMSFRNQKWVEFKVGRKSKSKKYDVEKITLQDPTNPKGVKHFIYNRQGRISFASGDMATNLIAMKPSVDFVMPPTEYFSGSEILTGEDGGTHTVKYMSQGTKMNSPVLVYLDDKPYKEFSHFKTARQSMRLEITGGSTSTSHPASRQKKWKRGERVKDEFPSAPMGLGENSFVVVPGVKKGTAGVVGVDESGYIISWFMRDASEKDAMKWFKEHSKPKDWEPEIPREGPFYTLENEKLQGIKIPSTYYF